MRRAQAYAKQLATVDKEGRDEAFFLKGIKYLGKLYDFDGSETFDFLGFQHILDRLDDGFDIATKLKEISDNMLLWIRYALILQRQCVLIGDITKIESEPYFRSNCIRYCRLDSIIVLCNCIPFFYLDLMPILPIQRNGIIYLLYLWEHSTVKWLTPLFTHGRDVGVETEFENSLSCLHCLPSCSQIQYSISTTRLPLRALPVQTRNASRLRDTKDFGDLVMMRIFYARPDHFLYRQYIAKNWFEFISELGGLCGIIIGFSLISAVEVIYFLITIAKIHFSAMKI
ncbi:pickpocket protein 11-like [Sitodiplosis mosellana]|uniref:pickpocket protein 11-like n=1 Tax=Sitodiplosis mosellana TaxID=263140 RepID=UPI002444ED1E|nr:pickpocket protein 11-like [Sitodiplosis mosellana]